MSGEGIAEAVLGLPLRGDPLEFGLVLRRPVIGEDDDVALPLDEDEIVEGRLDRGDRAVEQHGGRLDVLDHDAAGLEVLRDELVELRRQQVEGDEGAAIGIDHDDVEVLVGPRQPHPAVEDLDVEVLLVAHREELVGDLRHGGIEFDRRHRQFRHRLVVVPGGPPATEPDDRGMFERGRVGKPGGHRLGVVDGQVELVVRIDDGLGVAQAFRAEGEHVEAVRTPVDVDVVVERLDLRDDPGLGAGGERDVGLPRLPDQEGDDRADHDDAGRGDHQGGTAAASGRWGRGGRCRGGSGRLPGGLLG
jgi:hypothetical protein